MTISGAGDVERVIDEVGALRERGRSEASVTDPSVEAVVDRAIEIARVAIDHFERSAAGDYRAHERQILLRDLEAAIVDLAALKVRLRTGDPETDDDTERVLDEALDVVRLVHGTFNGSLVADFRAHGKVTGGRFAGRQLLLLTTVGRKSGAARTMPLAYSQDGDRYVVAASKGGMPTNPAWYPNLLQNPIVTVEVGTETFRARATVPDPAERRRLYDQHATVHQSFRDYEKRTSRVIPVVILERIVESA